MHGCVNGRVGHRVYDYIDGRFGHRDRQLHRQVASVTASVM